MVTEIDVQNYVEMCFWNRLSVRQSVDPSAGLSFDKFVALFDVYGNFFYMIASAQTAN